MHACAHLHEQGENTHTSAYIYVYAHTYTLTHTHKHASTHQTFHNMKTSVTNTLNDMAKFTKLYTLELHVKLICYGKHT